MLINSLCARFRIEWSRFRPRLGTLCCWTRHFTLTVPLSTQVYKCIPANLMLGETLQWSKASHPWGRGGGGGEEVFLVASCYRNRDKLRPDEPLLLVCRLNPFTLQKTGENTTDSFGGITGVFHSPKNPSLRSILILIFRL